MSDMASTGVEGQSQPAAPAGGRFAMLRPLRLHDFRLLFSGETVSLLGDQFNFIALAWLVLQLTGSGLALGTVLMTAAIPRLAFMLVGGALSDRLSPRTLMLASNAIRGVVVAIIAALALTGNAQLWQLYVLAAIFGVVDAIFQPAVQTIVPMLVRDDQLPAANALMQGTRELMGLVGPAAAGVLVAAVNTGPAFAIDAASFVVAAVALVAVRGGRRGGPSEPKAEASTGLLAEIGSGLRYSWQDPAVRALIVLTAALNLAFAGPMNVGLAWLADNRLNGGSAAYGIMLSGFGAGALAGAIAAGSMRRPRQLGRFVLLVAGAMGIATLFIGFATNVLQVVPIAVAIGVGVGLLNVHILAWLQGRTAPEMRGRVMSVVMSASHGLYPLSLAISGFIVDTGAATALFAAAGGIVIASALAGVVWGVPARIQDTP